MYAAINSNQNEALWESHETHNLASLTVLGLNQIVNIHIATWNLSFLPGASKKVKILLDELMGFGNR
jgi:hypothetical protein